MIAIEDVVLVLLAAGRSRRFGDVDKLEQPFLGQPLGLHVVSALADLPLRARFVVTDRCRLDFAGRGHTVIRNEHPERGMAGSVKLGVAAAKDIGAAAVLIALADMPRITATHILRLLDAADSSEAVVASSDGVPGPPAIFGAGRFDALLALDGDAGAREMVRGGRHVVTTPAALIDIDTPDDLARLNTLIGARRADAPGDDASGALTRGGARRSD